ncbi:UNVERIFIED_CONTAM: hypothetical protein PYX00_002219 [Menopon gallinae]|uniref:GPR180/TMEM145 transmembrane domain-containing protein n=1 Tax=Menopon gallinae TaxID=328185 RepID=A0AAW2IH47_9NEOP
MFDSRISFFDPGEVLYLYDSPAGYGLIILRIVAWWMFIYSTVFTLKHYPEKATFYYPFNIIGTLWFVAGPGVVLAANNLIDKWVRESIVCAAFHIVAFGGHVLFLILTLPSKANKNFPYHVRTNQIGMMEITGFSGNSSIYQFSHHPYAPGGPLPGRDVPLELFTVSRHFDLGRRDIKDYESQAFPHDLPPDYSQTVFLPITIRNNSEETTPESSGCNTPRTIEDSSCPKAKSSELISSEKFSSHESQRNSAEYSSRDADFTPSAPPDDEENKKRRNDSDSTQNSRPETASTISINTAMKNQEVQLSVEKLTTMFAAQSHRKA